MSTTTMHFGPEWMRTKHHTPARSQGPPPSPPPTGVTFNSGGLSTYSSLVSATPTVPSESTDDVHPFRYSKEDLLRIYQEGGGKGGLGLEVERWEGVVREIGMEPTTLRDMTDAERKLFSGPLNSELRRRPSQSTDFLSPLTTTNLDRNRIGSNSAGSPLRDRFGSIKRRDSAAGASDPMVTIPRKPSLSTLQQAAGMSPRDSSPRTRVGYSANFDGVLSTGDPWTPRRRASDNAVKQANGINRDSLDTNGVPKGDGIREEKEDDAMKQAHGSGEEGSPFTSSHSIHSEEHQPFDRGVNMDGKAVAGVGNPLPTHNLGGSNVYTQNRPDLIPNIGSIDLAAVEWSYKDPTGQIQGPFRADIMQKWYNDGYFAAELPMRRTKYDTNWLTVGELVAQANNAGNIFLTPPPSAMGPPGLSRASPMRHYLGQDPVYNEPYQPSPIRSLRTSALESYIGGGSLPSDSPSSSFGASHFGNASPEPSVFTNDHKSYHTPDPANSRLSGLVDSPMMNRRLPNHDYTPNLPSQLYGGYSRPQDPAFNPYGFNNNIHNTHDQWMMQTNAFGTPGYLQPRDVPQQHGFETHAQGIYAQESQSLGGSPAPRAAIYGGYGYPTNSTLEPLQQPDFTAGQVQESHPTAFTPALDAQDIPVNGSHQQVHHVEQEPVASPWPTSTTDNLATVVAQSPQPSAPPVQSPWGNVQPAAPSTVEEVPVSSMAHLTMEEAWPTPSAVAQEEVRVDVKPAPEVVQVPQEEKLSPPPAATPVDSTVAVSETPVSSTTASVERTSSSEAIPTPPKVAWAKEDDGKKKKGVTPSISLREIQEAEAKKAEARKAAEKEKERLVRASSTVADAKDDVQPFVASWGLPTSQAGSRATPTSASTLSSSPAPTTPQLTTPVWTTPAKPLTAKKTMKEIQEEEERRKKLAAKEAAVVAAPVKRYADTTSKTPTAPSPVVATNSVWTTVGPNGKSGAVPPVTKPSLPATPSSAPSVTARPTPSAVPARPSAAVVTKPKAVPADEASIMPSHEFLKWLGDSLKGLNSSVNVEEIISMLLSFPLDPDSLTMEIISDTIYSNSTTLDGRRFASEFVAKRKADAVGRKSSAKAASKPISIAEVVKATPKPTQSEWGGFKVVNKKKKGGRS